MKLRLPLIAFCAFLVNSPSVVSAQDNQVAGAGRDPYSVFISTGDNNYTGNSLPIDSKAAIEASFDLFKALGMGRIYWRGLEASTWIETNVIRKENVRYYSAWEWLHTLNEMKLDQFAVEAAHKRGMQIWGVGNLGDWASSADVPPFNDYPFNSETRLRIDHPEWVPVDRYGVLRQGGALDYSYPEARKAMIDITMKIMNREKYDGAMFFTYAENHSVRFQDEFGFNEPIVKEFKRRYGVDLRTQSFTRAASRADWVRLRGEYFTQFYRELRAEMKKNNQKLAAVLDPHDIYATQPWNIPEITQTAGPIYQDLETWVKEGLIDQFVVYGSSSGPLQSKAIDNAFWMTRNTPVTVATFTSSPPNDARWKPFAGQGLSIVNSFNEEEMFLDRSVIPLQPVSSLKSDQDILCMKILSQIIYGKEKATVADLAPLTTHKNLLIRRMSLKALGLTKDPAAIPIIEKGLQDKESCVRTIAALALGYNHGPQSLKKILETIDKQGNHSFIEIALQSLAKFDKSIKADLIKAYRSSKNNMVRSTALRAMDRYIAEEDIPVLEDALRDTDMFARFTAAQSLGNVRNSSRAIEVLIKETGNNDPLISDRAATSLAVFVSRKDPAMTTGLRAQMLEALRVLYGKLGDNCSRTDVDWGYRPVGNALLALGAEGEAVLSAYMNQVKDRRLAESAWKSLYIRQKPNSFSEVSEKENAEAYRMRPAFLNTTGAK